MTRWQHERGQSVADWAITISMVVAFVLGMQVFFGRALKARLKMATDALTSITPTDAGGEAPDSFPGAWKVVTQYEPYTADSELATKSNQAASTTSYEGGVTTRSGTLTNVERSGVEKTLDAAGIDQDDDWK